ncbi:hypothetical protein GQ53DRAFT_686996 [Thozetella sp. PMI_491]|nr:hypothetical protein GQ53DRAFT_686996 [Thozetella sp. PMI_491]
MGNSEGGNEWTDIGLWMGDGGVADYNRMLREAMAKFIEDFPGTQDAKLFICGYSAGGMFAGCTRPPLGQAGFSAPYYILVSYPVELNPLISLHKAGSYFRSIESLVRGHGWEKLPTEFGGKEPEVAGVFTVTGGYEKVLFYGVWAQSLARSDSRKVLRQVVVPGASHAWGDKSPRIVEEVDKWLQEIAPQSEAGERGPDDTSIPQPTTQEVA